jgi:hypothetical protein
MSVQLAIRDGSGREARFIETHEVMPVPGRDRGQTTNTYPDIIRERAGFPQHLAGP